jgi:hypothetical protein
VDASIVPVSVWQQLAVVLVFALLGYGALKVFRDIVREIANDYKKAIQLEREQHQREREADRQEFKQLLDKFEMIVDEFRKMSGVVGAFIQDFHAHDQMERAQIDQIKSFVISNNGAINQAAETKRKKQE